MTSKPPHIPMVKFLILGPYSAGKTGLMNRFVDNKSPRSIKSTIGVDFSIKSADIDGQRVKLQIWDTSGQETFRPQLTSLFRGPAGAYGVVLVYDITDDTGFENLSSWMDLIEQNARPNIPIILVATKSDLENERKVTTAQGELFAFENGLRFYETSSKDNVNVDAVFTDIGHAAYHFMQGKQVPEANNDVHIDLDSEIKSHPKKGCI